jgi:hypothetical protein
MLSFRRHEEEAQGEPAGKCFAFVQTFDEKPKRRLFELLKNQGMLLEFGRDICRELG